MNQDAERGMQHIRTLTLSKNEFILDKNAKVLVRKLDTKDSKEEAVKDIEQEHWEQINSNETNCF